MELFEQVDMTVGIVRSYVAGNPVPAADLPKLLNSVFAAVGNLANPQQSAPPNAPPVPAVPIPESITPDYLVCLDDGLKFKSLKRHITKLGMTPNEYRAKWGLPGDYPMVAPNYSRMRQQVAWDKGFGRRA